jgi:NAD(P)-dependent dehydrogenase (short-subunit alcohol dehydrogenase family)
MGARIVQIARDRMRGEAAVARLRTVATLDHTVHYGDLSLVSEMKRLAAAVAAAEPKIDVLINNAGAIFAHRQVTADGLELTFALNHMAYFVLAAGLRERLDATPGARIVNTASDAHRRGHIVFEDLQSERRYDAFRVYGTTKLCNIAFTRELARKLEGSGVTANALHPGFVATRFGDEAGGLYSWGIRFAKLFAIPPEQGARTIVYLASSPEVARTSGGFFEECRPSLPTREAQSDDVARRLWSESERIAGISW